MKRNEKRYGTEEMFTQYYVIDIIHWLKYGENSTLCSKCSSEIIIVLLNYITVSASRSIESAIQTYSNFGKWTFFYSLKQGRATINHTLKHLLIHSS
jgi:hypothetical protein